MLFRSSVAAHLGLNCLFISRESNVKGFQEYLKLLTVNAGVNFVLEEGWYNVCGKLDPVPHSCKQVVALHFLNSQGASTWQNNMLQYKL